MTTNEKFSNLEASMDNLIAQWRESLARKQERHGDDFAEYLAVTDLYDMLKLASKGQVAALAAHAINRLAHMEDYNPIPTEIADLDFETPNIEELMKDDGEQ